MTAMETGSEMIETAAKYHYAGDIDQAETLYGEILKSDPENPDALHLMGLAAHQKGESEKAVCLIEKAILHKPDQHNFYNSLGVIYEVRKQPQKAFMSFLQAATIKKDYMEAIQNIIRIKPGYYPAYFNLGVAFQHTGHYEEAAKAYVRTLTIKPDFTDAYNNLGIVLHRLGKIREAIKIYNQVIKSRKNAFETYNNLGVALHDLGQVEEAIHNLHLAIQYHPQYAEAFFNLGRFLRETDDIQTAIQYLKKAVAIKPDYEKALFELGTALQEAEEITAAEEIFRQVIQLNPDHAEAHFALGNNLVKTKNIEHAIQEFESAFRIKPDFYQAYYNLAFLKKKQGKIREAITNIEKVLRLRNDSYEAHNELGVLFQADGRLEQAIEKYRHSIILKADYPIARYNMGCALQDLNRREEAKISYQEAIAIDPDYAEAHVNLALLLLLEGDFKNGWSEYEWRYQRQDWKGVYPEYPCIPFWDGSCFSGKRLLVRNEQGMGDTLQFIRYLPMVKKRGGTVVFEAKEPLLPLLEGFTGVDEMILFQKEEVPDNIDFQVFLLSLPMLFETTMDTIPCEIPYLRADRKRTEHWKKKTAGNFFKVGLVWAGNPANPDNRFRSVELKYFEPLFSIPDIEFFGLQTGDAARQADHLSSEIRFRNLGREVTDF
ncbi:MAG: hypothetical protein C0403_19065, partial [Desulfobacterium sp.]|nr:hypothetical protein [Desulfobacterium sp.]